jgi:hypothetical protein
MLPSKTAPLHPVFLSNMVLCEEAKRLHALLTAHGIPCLFLKGIALLRFIYPLDKRPMVDVDVLVHPRDFHKTHLLLLTHGYTWKPWDSHPFTSAHIHEREYQSPLGVAVDLHHNLDLPLRWNIPIDVLFSHAVPMFEASPGMMRLCNEHMILHAAIHALKDALASPKSLQDMQHLMQHPNTSKNFLYEQAQLWKATHVLTLCLHLLTPSTPLPAQLRLALWIKKRWPSQKNTVLALWACVLQKKGSFVGTLARASLFRVLDFFWPKKR